MTTAYFVTGTDTGVGKTRTSCALLHALRATHAKCVGMKPFATGAEETAAGWSNDDVTQLRAASSLKVMPELDNPYLLPWPVSPHIAAKLAGQTIDIEHIVHAFDVLCEQADAVVVEGAGGFVVPLNETQTSADLAQSLDLPVILVVGIRLGCLNHALLTQEAIAARGLKLAGWVANRLDPDMPAQEENIATLRERLRAPLLADWPWAADATPESLTITLP
jgi:dethiobiotin synthetase